MLVLLAITLVVIIVLGYYRSKVTQSQDNAEKAFWEKELAAGNTRRQDLEKLDYITIPLEQFPLGLNTDAEKELVALSKERIKNFQGLSNTELKLQYGTANLDELSSYESNFIRLQQVVLEYAKELCTADRRADAIHILEFMLQNGGDISGLYLELATLYQQEGCEEKVQHLFTTIDQNFAQGPNQSTAKRLKTQLEKYTIAKENMGEDLTL
ncbi:MAG: hypothetical protein MR356_08205 [Agathobacter sp.]|nr:hypothetical protein [Agathobacter sp.]MDY3888357.1 hypothetical protein [Agathobacter sp.]